jgi:hypothetical protein
MYTYIPRQYLRQQIKKKIKFKREITYKNCRYYSSVITKQHAADGSSDADKPGKLAGLGLLDGVEIINVDLVDGIWRTCILEMLETFLGIGLGHGAGG